jgi:hypothetical protein
MYLSRLASDDVNMNDEYSQVEYSSFLMSYINTTDRLIEVIKVLKCRLNFNNIEDFFEPLRNYIETYKPKQSAILKTSHAFCECELYTPSFLCVWVRNNPELFETEINFYHRLFKYFGGLIKHDVAAYPTDELYVGDDTPLSGQTNREKLKLLSSVVKHYEYICKYLM